MKNIKFFKNQLLYSTFQNLKLKVEEIYDPNMTVGEFYDAIQYHIECNLDIYEDSILNYDWRKDDEDWKIRVTKSFD